MKDCLQEFVTLELPKFQKPMNQRAAMHYATHEGREEGRMQGLEEGRAEGMKEKSGQNATPMR